MILKNNKTIDEEKEKRLLSEQEAKILIVDDEKDIRKLVGIYLKKQGYKTLEAENGQMAIDIMKEHSDIDLVIMDIMMPGMSGTESCAAIREFSSVPVLFLTAKTQEPDKNEAYDIGGDDFLSKPFEQGELIRKVKALIRRYNVYKGRYFSCQIFSYSSSRFQDLPRFFTRKNSSANSLSVKWMTSPSFVTTRLYGSIDIVPTRSIPSALSSLPL